MTVVEVLKALNAYPIPMRTLEALAVSRGVDPSDEVTHDNRRELALAKADVYTWLATAPDVSQGGQSYSFSDEQRTHFKMLAGIIYNEEGEARKTTIYGYKGSRL